MTKPDTTESTDVESLMADLEERVLALTRSLFTWAALPALLGYHALEWFHGEPTPWVAAEVLATGIAVGALWSGASRNARSWVLLAQLLVMGVTSLLHFGPTMGTGLFFLGATLCAAFLKSEAVTVIVVMGLSGFVGVTAGAQRLGLVHPISFSPRLSEWPRIAAASIIAITGCAFVFVLVNRSLRTSLSAEISARRREKEAQQERERLLLSAERTQRLEALGRLAGGVAHDFNNALTVIRGAVELIKTTPDEAVRRELLRDIDEGVERATATARQLLAFARRSPNDAAMTNPAERIEQIARSVSRLLPANVHIHAEAARTPEIALSAGAFDQIVLNLVLNARDAMPNGGTILLTSREDRGSSIVEVEDSGEGMSQEVRTRLFEPFFTTKGEDGTGLGLAMVWGLVTRASGTIEVDSKPGRGSRFRLRFPPAAPAKTGESARPAPRGRDGRVLALDDEPDVLRLLVRMLQRTGLDVDPVSSVAEALSHLESEGYRLLVTDGVVPDGPVSMVIQRFRERNAGASVIVCSGYLEDSVVLEGISRNDIQFLQKPFSAEGLSAVVDRALGRGS